MSFSDQNDDYDEKINIDSTRTVRTSCGKRPRDSDVDHRKTQRRRKISNGRNCLYTEANYRRMSQPCLTEQRTPTRRYSSTRSSRQQNRRTIRGDAPPGIAKPQEVLLCPSTLPAENNRRVHSPSTTQRSRRREYSSPSRTVHNNYLDRGPRFRQPPTQRSRRREYSSPSRTVHNNYQERGPRFRTIERRSVTPRRNRRPRHCLAANPNTQRGRSADTQHNDQSHYENNTLSHFDTDHALAVLLASEETSGEGMDWPINLPSNNSVISSLSGDPFSIGQEASSNRLIESRSAQILSDELLARSLQFNVEENYVDMYEDMENPDLPNDDIFAYELRNPFLRNPTERFYPFSPIDSENFYQDGISAYPRQDFIPDEYHYGEYPVVPYRERLSEVVQPYLEFGHLFHSEESHGFEEQKVSRGAEQHVINELPTRRFKVKSGTRGESNYQKSCCICMDDFRNSDKVRTLPCLHFFHTGCIDKWLLKNKTCPVCKFDITHNRESF